MWCKNCTIVDLGAEKCVLHVCIRLKCVHGFPQPIANVCKIFYSCKKNAKKITKNAKKVAKMQLFAQIYFVFERFYEFMQSCFVTIKTEKLMFSVFNELFFLFWRIYQFHYLLCSIVGRQW